MDDDKDGLDGFISSDAKPTIEQGQPENKQESVDLQDEFTKLLSDFIKENNQSDTPTQHETPQVTDTEGLNAFLTQPENNTASAQSNTAETMNNSLDSFISSNTENNETPKFEGAQHEESGGLDSLITNVVVPAAEVEADPNALKSEEQELARAINNFKDGMTEIARRKNLKLPQTDYKEEQLKPNYKPSVGKKIAQYLLDCWNIINKYDPENMQRLSPEATDEDYLNFAEGLNDTYLQLVIISYVEILINIEICEVNYEQKRELILKNQIKKELYEEYMELQERKNLFIQKLKEKNFPIDTEKLINNYFRAAQKDADGAFEALTKNPAMFSHIDFEKMHDKFFGLIKVSPEDGIKANQKIGNFIKKLKI